MVKHVILWKLKDEIKGEEKQKVAEGIKDNLEALVGKVPGLIDLTIIVDKLDSSNADVMLDSTLDSVEALHGYQKHPAHVECANTYVRPYTELRLCMDYEV